MMALYCKSTMKQHADAFLFYVLIPSQFCPRVFREQHFPSAFWGTAHRTVPHTAITSTFVDLLASQATSSHWTSDTFKSWDCNVVAVCSPTLITLEVFQKRSWQISHDLSGTKINLCLIFFLQPIIYGIIIMLLLYSLVSHISGGKNNTSHLISFSWFPFL